MKKNKLKKIISICILLIAFFSIYNFFKKPEYIPTFQKYNWARDGIHKSIVHSVFKNEYSTNDMEYKEKELIEIVLDIIDYDKWMDFLNYIDMNLYYGNISSSVSQELIISLNLSKDVGVIVIFEEHGNNYVFNSKIENLSPIEDIKFLNHPTENKDFIAVYQVNSENLGAFFRENFVEIYDYTESNHKLVWEKNIIHEEIYNDTWLYLEADDSNWTMIVEKTEIDFDYTNSLKINTITSIEKYKANSKLFPNKSGFSLDEKKSFVRSYHWSDKYNSFILGKLS